MAQGPVFWLCVPRERIKSSFFCGFHRFSALIVVCGSVLQREHQPDFSIDPAVHRTDSADEHTLEAPPLPLERRDIAHEHFLERIGGKQRGSQASFNLRELFRVLAQLPHALAQRAEIRAVFLRISAMFQGVLRGAQFSSRGPRPRALLGVRAAGSELGGAYGNSVFTHGCS